jgi:hypothetical protein
VKLGAISLFIRGAMDPHMEAVLGESKPRFDEAVGASLKTPLLWPPLSNEFLLNLRNLSILICRTSQLI